ncbi:hypothetical protein BH23ACT4_BH23ACT4_14200 [soil metagenome]
MRAEGTFERVILFVYYSRSGDEGMEQYEGSADTDPEIGWFVFGEGAERVALDQPPFVIDGNRVSGSLTGLEQTWPEGGTDTVDVTFDFEIPTTISADC